MSSFEWHGIQVTGDSVEYTTAKKKFYIKLSQIDGAEVDYTDYKLFIIFGVLILFSSYSEQVRVPAIIAGLFLIILYFATRKLVLKVHGGNIVIKREINAKDLSEAENFITNLKNLINSVGK